MLEDVVRFMECSRVMVHAIQVTVSQVRGIALVVFVCTTDEANRKCLLSGLFFVIVVGSTCSTILCCNRLDQAFIRNSDFNLFKHFNQSKE
jgi:hypothetical protein